jgi:hypothetical protein
MIICGDACCGSCCQYGSSTCSSDTCNNNAAFVTYRIHTVHTGSIQASLPDFSRVFRLPIAVAKCCSAAKCVAAIAEILFDDATNRPRFAKQPRATPCQSRLAGDPAATLAIALRSAAIHGAVAYKPGANRETACKSPIWRPLCEDPGSSVLVVVYCIISVLVVVYLIVSASAS